MKIIAQLCRILTGSVFIFSGLIKLNDPIGTQIKLEEYFEVFAQDLPALHNFFEALVPYAIYFSVALCALEVVLGVALLLAYKLRTTAWVLLGMVVYFGFLTFYSAYFNKVTDCGCFGDAIKLKPWESFWKDMVLLIFILVILWKRHIFKQLPLAQVITILSVAGSLFVGIHAIQHFPVIDFLPYKISDNIAKNMQPSEALKYKYILEKNGETIEFEQYPTDTTYKFKEMVLLNENAKPKITDYRLWKDTVDFTPQSFMGKKLFVIIQSTEKTNTKSLPAISQLAKSLKGSDIELIILMAGNTEAFKELQTAYNLTEIPYYFIDVKVAKTIVRSNPGLWLLQDGIVRGKWHYNDIPSKEDIIKIL